MKWVQNDLTTLAGATPAGASSVLDGYAQVDGSQHVNFVDVDGHVHELYKSPDPAAQWVDNDLTTLARATPAASGNALDGYALGDGSQHVNFIDQGSHVHELYKSPHPTAQWVDNDLTTLARATPAALGGAIVLDGYAQVDGSEHVNFIDVDGHVHELYKSPDPAARWVDNDLTTLAGATPGASGNALDGYAQVDGSRHVNFIDQGRHVHELYRSPDAAARWVDNDLTTLAGATLVPEGSALDGYAQVDGSRHVNFMDGFGHIHELYRSPDAAAQWVDNDLTKLAGATPARWGDAFDGSAQVDGSQHVIFIDVDGHVHELYRSPDPAAQWVDNDLTTLAGAPPAAFGPALDGYAQGDGSQHVNFIAVPFSGGHIHELYRSP